MDWIHHIVNWNAKITAWHVEHDTPKRLRTVAKAFARSGFDRALIRMREAEASGQVYDPCDPPPPRFECE